MGQARHLLSLVLAALAMTAVTASLGGCGSSDESGDGTTGGGGGAAARAPAGAVAQSCARSGTGMADLRVSGVDCDEGRGLIVFWRGQHGCRAPAGASRVSCGVAGYRCLGASVDRGLAISCARPSRSISFLAPRD